MPPKSAVVAGFQNESTRLSSFTKGTKIGNGRKQYYWPHDTEILTAFAEAGFYYTPTKASVDQVTCFWCGKKEKNLQDTTDIVSLHLSHNPQCPYATIFRYLKMFQACESGEIAEFLKNSEYPKISESLRDQESFWPTIIHEMSLPDAVAEPHTPASIDLRLATFSNLWKFDKRKKSQLSARKMALSGFFYAPREPGDDRVICMYCGCPLSAWDLDDDPLQEHINNSRQFRGNSNASQCYFLSTQENQDDILERNTGAELEHIPSDTEDSTRQSPTNSPKVAKSPKNEKESSPLNGDLESLEGLLASSSDLSEIEPIVSGTPEKSATEFDAFDISIDQLSDHGTLLDRQNQHDKNIRRYPRRNKQPASYKNNQFKAHNILKKEHKSNLEAGPKEKAKPDTSLILEVKDAEHKSDHDSPSSGHHSLEMEVDPTIDPEITHLSMDAGSHVSPPLDGDSSIFQQESSTFNPQDSEDGDFIESIDDSSPQKSHSPKKNIKLENPVKLSKSQFSDDDFGINEADIAKILKSPKKDRKIKIVKKVGSVATPALQDISDQNLGDYDEKNLSFIEKDIKVNTESQGQSTSDAVQEKLSEGTKKTSTQKTRYSFSINPPEASFPDSSVVEIAQKTKKSQKTVPIISETPEKIQFGSDIDAESTIDIQNDEVVEKVETDKTVRRLENTDDDVIFDASPQKLQTIEEASSDDGHNADSDDMQIDYNDADSIGDTFGTAPEHEGSESNPIDERATNSIVKKEMTESTENLEELKKTEVNEVLENGDESEKEEKVKELGILDTVPAPPTSSPRNSPKLKTKIRSDLKDPEVSDSPTRSKSPSLRAGVGAPSTKPNDFGSVAKPEFLERKSKSPPRSVSDTEPTRNFEGDQKLENPASDREIPRTAPALVDNNMKKRSSSKVFRKESATKRFTKSDENSSITGVRAFGDAPFKILDEDEILPDGGSPKKRSSPSSNAQEGSESPEKEVVISPSAYREYRTDYAKMADEFDSVARESEADVTRQSEDNMEEDVGGDIESMQIAAEISQEEEKPVLKKKLDSQENKHTALDAPEEKRSPSFIGNSVSEIAPILLEPPTSTPSQNNLPAKKPPVLDRSQRSTEKLLPDLSGRTAAGRSPVHEKTQEGGELTAQLISEPHRVVSKSKESSIARNENEDRIDTVGGSYGESKNKTQVQTPKENERLSFQGIEASTPNQTARDLPKPLDGKIPHFSMDAALAELQEIDDTIDYVLGLASQGYELHNDEEGELTDFISKLPEEEEDMTIEEWIKHNAAVCKRAVEEKGGESLSAYEAHWDQLIDCMENLEAID